MAGAYRSRRNGRLSWASVCRQPVLYLLQGHPWFGCQHGWRSCGWRCSPTQRSRGRCPRVYYPVLSIVERSRIASPRLDQPEPASRGHPSGSVLAGLWVAPVSIPFLLADLGHLDQLVRVHTLSLMLADMLRPMLESIRAVSYTHLTLPTN